MLLKNHDYFYYSPDYSSAFYPGPFTRWAVITIVIFYGLLTIGTICTWWIPYFFGSPGWHKAGFIEYKHTHTFLPARGDNVVPNTLHVILHLFVWSCFGYSLYYMGIIL